MSNKILICGAFDFVQLANGGQPVKSRELYYTLQEKLGPQNIDYVETKTWSKNPLKVLVSFIRKTPRSQRIIMLPAHRGVFVFSFLLLFAKWFWLSGCYFNKIYFKL